jgi:adenosine deaminase
MYKAGDIHIVAHAGEEGKACYIREALDILHAERIDHGVRCWADKKLVQRLKDEQIPLTVCPLSNIRLKIFDRMEEHNLKQMLDSGLNVSIHSDDPAYFSGYINENYFAVIDALGIDEQDILKLARNAINSSFLPESEKLGLHQRLCDNSRPILEELSELAERRELI